MKKFLITSILATLVAAGTTIMAQEYPEEYLGLPGDNLNLYAVMKLFQESETIEGFEKNLNDENSRINNLDLNGDNYIDYLKVIDYVDGDVHTIVLQAVLDRNETQDVAVFSVQRFRDGSVEIQLTGDEALYGRNYIIEPIFDETPNPGYLGRSNGQNVNVVRTTTIQIASWPLVRYIYMPNYNVWRSSWYWGYYPSYWHPWRPFYWHYYYGYHYHWYPEYYSHYRHWNNHRYSRWNDFYYNGHRSYSRNVGMRINSGDYRTTYSHPEYRRDGEALYTKVHPDRSTRSSTVSSGNDNGRRSVSQSSTSGQSAGTSAGSRRSNSTVTNRSDATRSSAQSSGTSRRSTSTVTNRSESTTSGGRTTVRQSSTTGNDRVRTTTPAGQSTSSSRRSSSTVSSSGQSTSPSRQSSTTVNTTARSNSSAGQAASSSRRSSSSGSAQSVSRPAPSQRTESARSSGPSKSSAASSARRSSSKSSSKSSGTSKATSKAKDSEGKSTSRRK